MSDARSNLATLTVSEMAEEPPRVASPLPDIEAPNPYPFHGSAGGEIRRLQAEIDRLRRRVAELELERGRADHG